MMPSWSCAPASWIVALSELLELDYYRSQSFARPIEKLVISGGTALCSGIGVSPAAQESVAGGSQRGLQPG